MKHSVGLSVAASRSCSLWAETDGSGGCSHTQTYKERVLDLGVRCAQEAAKHKLDAYIDFSTAQVYEPGKVPSPSSADRRASLSV